MHTGSNDAEHRFIAAIKEGQVQIVREILDNPNNFGEITVNHRDNSTEFCDTPLIIAADSGNIDMINLLLSYAEKGIPGDKYMLPSIEQTDSIGSSPLFFCRNAAVAKIFLDAGASMFARNKQDSTPLHVHSWHGRQDVVELLCQCMQATLTSENLSAAINATNNYLRTPLHRAAEIQQHTVYDQKSATCKTLIQYGANLYLEDEEFNNPGNLARDSGYDELADDMITWVNESNKSYNEGDCKACEDCIIS